LDISGITRLKRAGELAPLAVLVNMIHDRLIRQSVELSVRKLEEMGLGRPPVPYAFLLFGSGGRQEQALVSDQDNGLVYQLPPHLNKGEREEVHKYFHLFGASIVQGLEEAGYPPCHGNVTCVHNRWRGSIEQWIALYDDWRNNPTWENARYLLLAGDARVLTGDASIFAPVEAHYYQQLINNPLLLSRLASNTLYHRVPLGWFGRITTEVQGRYRGAINLKNGVYLPFVNCVRHYALACGVRATTTLERAAALREKGIWPEEFSRSVEHHFRQLLGLRLLPPLHWQDEQYLSNSYIKLSELPKETLSTIKAAMKLALLLQKMTAKLPHGNL
jgi:CBS domain-containing protein